MERFDSMFITVAQEAGGIEGLLNSFFSFLLRRTDFYYESDPGDNMGFPPEIAEKMLFKIFQKYQNYYYEKHPKKTIKEYNQKLEIFNKAQNPNKTSISTEKKEPIKKEEKIQVKLSQEKKIEKQVQPISTHNGGTTKNYNWSQGIKDVTMGIQFDHKIKGKDLSIEMKAKSLKVFDKIKNEIIVDGELYDYIKVDESCWTIEDNQQVILTLEKAEENIWKTIIIGDEEIDTQKVDNTKKLEEFDDETQGALRKVMYEQNRKQRGLLTTEEEAQQEVLKKAWNAPGSPFQGTPFDPSKFNIPSNQEFLKKE